MAWREQKTSTGTDLVWGSIEGGIAPSPLKGTANIQNANISTDMGEIMASYNRMLQQGTGTQASITNGTFTASPGDGTQLLATSSPLKAGYWINISSSTISRTNTLSIQYLVVAGGGSGGGSGGTNNVAGGGGGAGGFLSGTGTVTVTSYAVTVGAGGAAPTAGANAGNNGSDSSIATIATATGGGGGATHTGTTNGKNGGSGGGAGSVAAATGGTGTVGQGSNGGAIVGGPTMHGGGGGGGAGATGETGIINQGGTGGNGLILAISGSSVTYAGGGGAGGGGNTATGSAGGTGGGGAGATNDANGIGATINTGSGGGGAASGGSGTNHSGGAGGSGIVIIRYPTGQMTATGGTITTSGDYTVHTFTSGGTFQVTASPTLTGNFFVSYQDTNGKVKISQNYDPLSTNPIIHGTSGTATFSTVNPIKVAAPIAKATEKYQDSDSTEYRYYILDSSGYIWVYDTGAYSASLASSGVGTLWMLPDPTDNSSLGLGGIGVLGGWLHAIGKITIYVKPTVSLGRAFQQMSGVGLMSVSQSTYAVPHFAYVGHQGKLYYTDSTYIGEVFPTTSLASGVANIQSYSRWEDNSSTDTEIEVQDLISGSLPLATGGSTRIPVVFFTDQIGTLPPTIIAGNVYWLESTSFSGTFAVFDAQSGGTAKNISGGMGTQYFNTYYPLGSVASASGSNPLVTFSNQRVNLPSFETATCMVEIGNTIIIGGVTNTLYPWNQIDATPSDLIALPEAGVKTMINVNNMAYVFAGNKGNIYITNNSVASLVYKIPDYCAGVPGTPNSYIEPYFTWGDAEYIRGRVYFSILDQTAIKAGNCGGVWSFVPTQNFSYGQDSGIGLRLENQNSYGSYNGLATVIIGSQMQNAIAPQYWAGWQNSYTIGTSTLFGIDFTGTVPVVTYVIETDIIPTGTILVNQTFNQVEYKMSTPLAVGDSVQLYWRLNITDAWTSAGTVQEDSLDRISGYFSSNFENTQWTQLRAVVTTTGTTDSSFSRLTELILR